MKASVKNLRFHRQASPFSSKSCSRRALLVGAAYLLSMGYTHTSTFTSIKFQSEEQKAVSLLTNFVPRIHGFHFRNTFVNVVLNTSLLHLVTYGRCGGMAFAALDYYFATEPIPRSTQMPECDPEDCSPGSLQNFSYTPQEYELGHYIFKRQIDSMLCNRVADFLWYTLVSDKEAFQWTVTTELVTLRSFLQAGIPVPLGLISVHDISRIGENHQVVAYGCEIEACSNKISQVYVYDSNYPDQNVKLTLDYQKQSIQSSTQKTWRGFFVRTDYIPTTLPQILLPG